MKLTKKQKQLLDFINGFTKGQGYSPTYREIMQALGYKSVSTVAKHVDNLAAIGALVKQDGQARSIEVREFSEPVDNKAVLSWEAKIEREINKRQQIDTGTAREELAILNQALKILKSPIEI